MKDEPSWEKPGWGAGLLRHRATPLRSWNVERSGLTPQKSSSTLQLPAASALQSLKKMTAAMSLPFGTTLTGSAMENLPSGPLTGRNTFSGSAVTRRRMSRLAGAAFEVDDGVC